MSQPPPGLRYRFDDGKQVIEQIALPADPELILWLVYRKPRRQPQPVIITAIGPPGGLAELVAKQGPAPGSTVRLEKPIPVAWGNFVEQGYLLAQFLPRPNKELAKEKQAVWPITDARFADAFAHAAQDAPGDLGLVIDYLETRPEADGKHIGYVGFSASALYGAAYMSKERRLSTLVLFAGAPAFRELFKGWQRNKVWKGPETDIWPMTDERLKKHDPVQAAASYYPTAILMVNGGKDLVIPIEATEAFYEAVYPHYLEKKATERFELIVLAGHGHDVINPWTLELARSWFERYLKPK